MDISGTEDPETGDNALLRGTIYDEQELQIEEQSFEDDGEFKLLISRSDKESSGEEPEENERIMRHSTERDDRNIENSLQSVFGYVASCGAVIEQFCTAEQGQYKSIADWGIRLENILQKAIDNHVIETEKNETLRRKFFRSLYSQELTNATQIHFETINDFEKLRQKVREEEYEIKARELKRNSDTKKKQGRTVAHHQPVFKAQ